jgi:5'-3' exoribonuclease 1
VDHVISEDERFIERDALPVEEEFPEGSKAFFLGEYNYGAPVHIVGHDGDKLSGMISVVKGKEPEFGHEHARNAEKLSPYTPSFAIARNLQLNPLTLAKVTSSFSVEVEGQRVNLGLNLKFEAKKLKVLGYSRRGASGWEFSEKAVTLLREYMIKFPDFIAGIQRKPQGDAFQATDFYPAEVASARIKEIQVWLKSIESKSFERVPLEAEQLDSDVVRLIEQAADDLVRSRPDPEAKRIKGIPRAALLKPSDAEQRLGNQRFSLGDRIIYAQESGKVPIATKGTVVGLTRTSRMVLLDVIFDLSFMSGSSLGDRCSPFRGSTVPASSVLNLTERQLVAESRTSNQKNKAQQQQQPLTVLGYGAPLGKEGLGPLRKAQTPPPLRGTYRGAVTGQQRVPRGNDTLRGRGGRSRSEQVLPVRNRSNSGDAPQQSGGNRGRGGRATNYGNANDYAHRSRGGASRSVQNHITRAGYISVEKIDPDAGVVQHNPNFRPQSYNSVPPPSTLDRRGGRDRSRGVRGSGRGRGRLLGRGNGDATA